eukprot:1393385-Amphidinium_carterae.1
MFACVVLGLSIPYCIVRSSAMSDDDWLTSCEPGCSLPIVHYTRSRLLENVENGSCGAGSPADRPAVVQQQGSVAMSQGKQTASGGGTEVLCPLRTQG